MTRTMMALSMPNKNALAIFISVITLLIFAGRTSAESGDTKWSVEPFLSSGVVYEFVREPSPCIGAGVSAEYHPNSWLISAGYRIDSYSITYYGIPEQTILDIYNNVDTSSPLLKGFPVSESKERMDILIGRHVIDEKLSLHAGAFRISLNNNFSSMTSNGVLAAAVGRLDAGLLVISYRADFGASLSGSATNHRDDLVTVEGSSTISFYGAPKYFTGWSAEIETIRGAWGLLSTGYEGSLITLEHGYRYYHGVSFRARF